MSAALVLRLSATSISAFFLIFIAGESSAWADVSQRHDFLPGLRLSARSNQVLPHHPSSPSLDKSILDPSQKSKFDSQNLKVMSWEAICREPVKVSFFGDFWVPPNSAAAQLKGRLFDHLQPLLKWGDFNVANFEGNITGITKRAFPKFPYALKQATDSVDWLHAVGIKYFTRANNHSMDFGWQGARDTSAAMQKAGVQYTGIGADIKSALKPLILEKDEIKIAVFSLTTTYPAEAWAGEKRPGVAHPASGVLRKAIEQTRSVADFVVVVFHWGDELKPVIKSHQQEYANQVLKAGADLVIGHHAHVAQKVDINSDDGIVAYGIGNFVFSSLSRDAKFGLAAHVEFCRSNTPEWDGTTHRYRMVLSPLFTYNRATGYRTRPMTRQEFLPVAREYLKKGYFSGDLEFYISAEDRVESLTEWLQPRSQNSKEGQVLN